MASLIETINEKDIDTDRKFQKSYSDNPVISNVEVGDSQASFLIFESIINTSISVDPPGLSSFNSETITGAHGEPDDDVLIVGYVKDSTSYTALPFAFADGIIESPVINGKNYEITGIVPLGAGGFTFDLRLFIYRFA